jgi:hypothetical protein
MPNIFTSALLGNNLASAVFNKRKQRDISPGMMDRRPITRSGFDVPPTSSIEEIPNLKKRAKVREGKLRRLLRDTLAKKRDFDSDRMDAYSDQGGSASSAFMQSGDRYDVLARDEYTDALTKLMESENEQDMKERQIAMQERGEKRADKQLEMQQEQDQWNREMQAQQMGMEENKLQQQQSQFEASQKLKEVQMNLNKALEERKLDLATWTNHQEILAKREGLELEREKLVQAGEQFLLGYEQKGMALFAEAVQHAERNKILAEQNAISRLKAEDDIRYRQAALAQKDSHQKGLMALQKESNILRMGEGDALAKHYKALEENARQKNEMTERIRQDTQANNLYRNRLDAYLASSTGAINSLRGQKMRAEIDEHRENTRNKNKNLWLGLLGTIGGGLAGRLF